MEIPNHSYRCVWDDGTVYGDHGDSRSALRFARWNDVLLQKKQAAMAACSCPWRRELAESCGLNQSGLKHQTDQTTVFHTIGQCEFTICGKCHKRPIKQHPALSVTLPACRDA